MWAITPSGYMPFNFVCAMEWGGGEGFSMNDFKKPHKYGFQSQIPIPGATNDGFLLHTLKTLFRLSRVLLDL